MTVYPTRKGFHYSPITIHKYMNKEMGLCAIVRPKKPEYIYRKPHKVFENKLSGQIKMVGCVITAVFLICMTAASLRIKQIAISHQN